MKPEGDRRKDFDDKAYSRFLVVLSEEKLGYDVYVPNLDTDVFNEVVPNSTAEYFSEVEKLIVRNAASR